MVIIIENSPEDATLIVHELQGAGYEPEWIVVETAAELISTLAKGPWELIISDYSMPAFSSAAALEIYKAASLDVPFFLVSGAIGEEKAVEVMRAGAHDYIMKDRLERLGPAVERALCEALGRRERREADCEIRRLNVELREQIELLSQSHAEREEFTFMASHDLKEPLRTVANYTELLLSHRPVSPDADEREFAGYIQGAVTRMWALIDGLVAYSRADRGANETRQPADANGIASAALSGLEAAIEESGAVVTIEPLPAVMIKTRPLLDIFQYLIANALKYQSKGQSPRITVSAVEQDGQVQFAVADNGIGIEPEHYERIFKLFGRLHGSEYPGVGTGLAVSKRIVERNGGRIWLDSKPGVGSTFYFTVPAAEPIAQTAAGV